MAITICGKTLSVPILQGGMGIGVSLDNLAGAVARCGGMGTLSSAVCGFDEPDFAQDPRGANLRALERQVRRAKTLAQGHGMVAVNIMVATAQYEESVLAALRAGADAIVCGAGLPKNLPALSAQVPGQNAALAPIVSSGKAAALLCRLWDRHYKRLPDFIVLEGPLAGGHLGFSPQEAQDAQAGSPKSMEALLSEVLDAIAPFQAQYGRHIPVFCAGGVKNGEEMKHLMQCGAAGAQFATRFITTKECDASERYKEAILRAQAEDIAIVQSPVGMPGRALRSPLIRRVESGIQPKPQNCIRCITPCDPRTAPYCISKALIAAQRGDWENGLFFCGANVADLTSLSTVAEQIEQIMTEWRSTL